MLQGKIADLTKTAKTPGGISLFTDKTKTTYKSTYQLLKEIASIYHDLTDKQQAGLLEALAGKRGGQVLAGLLDDFSEVEKAMGQISESAGSADDEMKIIRESISYQLNALKQTWVGFLQDLIDRGTIQKFLENLTLLSEKFIKLAESNPLVVVGGIMGLVKAIKALMAGNIIKNATTALTEFIGSLNLLKNGVFFSTKFGAVSTAMTELTTTTKAATASVTGLSVASKSLWESLIPLLPAIAGVAAVGAVLIIDEAIERHNEKLRQSAVEAADALNSEQQALNNQISQYDELAEKLKNSSLSESEIYDIKKQLYNLQKDLNEAYDLEAGSLDLVNGKYEEQLKLLQDISAEKANQYVAENYKAYNNALDVVNRQKYFKFASSKVAFDNVWGGGILNTLSGETTEERKKLIAQTRAILSQGIDPAYIKGVSNGIIEVEVDAEHAEEVLNQLFDNFEELEKETGQDLSEFKNAISSELKSLANDEELQQSLDLVKQYNKQQVIANDTLRPIYAEAIQAVEDYNQALALSDGSEEANKNIEETKRRLDEVKAKYVENADAVKVSGEVFSDVWDQVNTTAAKEYEINKLFASGIDNLPDAAQRALNKIKLENLTDFELRDIDLSANLFNEGNLVSVGFRELADALGISQDEVDILIDKLVELGYVEGGTEEATKKFVGSISDIATSVENVSSRLKPQFDALSDAYQKIFYGDDGTFSLDRVDTEMMESLRSTFLGVDEELEKAGIKFDVAPINKFLDVITSAETKSKSLAEQQEITQQAVNDLATTYFYAADGLKDLNDETRDALEQQFTKMGITNAKEIVDQIQYTQELQNEIDEMFANISFDDISEAFEQASENLDNEYQKILDLGLDEYSDDIINHTIQSVFGNVDMDKRAIIQWSDELKETYKAELASWKYDPEIGSIDTVFGMSNAFWLGDQEVEIAFTPIIEVDDHAEFVGQKTIDEYIQTILDAAAKDGDWSLDEILKLDAQGLDVNKYDEQGRVIGKQFVHGVIAGVGEEGDISAIDIGSLLHFSGESGAIQLAEKELETYNELKDKIAQGTLSLTNITADEIAILQTEGIIAEATSAQLAQLALQEQLASDVDMSSSDSVQSLYALAQMAHVATEYIQELNEIMGLFDRADAAQAEGRYKDAGLLRAEAIKRGNEVAERMARASQEPLKINLDFQVPNAKNAGSQGGKEAGEAAKEAFDKELSELKESYERGEITLKEYLDKYRALIDKYFGDTEKYAKERAKALHDYLVEMKGYYDSAISGVTTLLDFRIKAAQKQKEKAIKAIEEERDAQINALEDQKKAIQKVIKEKQKQIKAIEKMKKPLQDEIDKIREANEERDRELQLQKDLYELEKLQNQRTQFIYKDGQMVYQTDPDAIRNQRQQVEQDEDDKKIAALEKQIEAYDKQIEAINSEIELLQEQSDLIDEQIDSLNEFYDKLIKEQEEYWDSIIEALENTKSKWEELAEVEKITSAWKDVGEVMEMMGYTVEDVLNDTPGAFEAFKDTYLQMCMDVNNGNKYVTQGVQEWATQTQQNANVAARSIADATGDISSSTGQIQDDLEKTKDAADKATESLSKVGGSTSNMGGASSTIKDTADSAKELDENTEDLPENINNTNDALQNVDGSSLDTLSDTIATIRNILIGEDEASGLLGALELLPDQVDITSIIEQFTALQTAIEGAVSALNGGGGGAESAADAFGSGGGKKAGGSTSGKQLNENAGGAGGLVGAIEAVKEATDANIGGGEETEGTAVGAFEALGEAVDDVTAAIGGGGEEGGKKAGGNIHGAGQEKSASGGDTLIGSIEDLGETAVETVEGEIIPRFETFRGILAEAQDHVEGILEGITAIDGQHAECSIKINIETVGGGILSLLKYTGTAMPWSQMNLDSAEYIAQYATGTAHPHFGGSAYVRGDWGVQQGGKALVGELGQEVVIRKGRFWTVGDNGPEFVNLEPNDIVLNHLQTQELLDKKNLIKPIGAKGRAYAEGTLPNGITPLSQSNPEAFNSLVQNAELLKANTDDMKADLSNIGYATDDIKRAVQNITNNSKVGTTINFGDLQFTCNGITSAEVLNEVGNALQREFQGLALNAYQRAVNMA